MFISEKNINYSIKLQKKSVPLKKKLTVVNSPIMFGANGLVKIKVFFKIFIKNNYLCVR